MNPLKLSSISNNVGRIPEKVAPPPQVSHRALEIAGAEGLDLYKQSTEEYINGMRARRTQLVSGGPEKNVKDVNLEDIVEAAPIPATEPVEPGTLFATELPSDNNMAHDVQKTENVRMSVTFAFPEVSEHVSGHGDAIHNNENKVQESLYNAVAAATKLV